jgi:hypothetical protein
MDGRGRWLDYVLVERLWRSLKYEEVHPKAYANGLEARTHRPDVQRARMSYGARGEFICADLVQLDGDQLGTFDRVLSFGVLHHHLWMAGTTGGPRSWGGFFALVAVLPASTHAMSRSNLMSPNGSLTMIAVFMSGMCLGSKRFCSRWAKSRSFIEFPLPGGFAASMSGPALGESGLPAAPTKHEVHSDRDHSRH